MVIRLLNIICPSPYVMNQFKIVLVKNVPHKKSSMNILTISLGLKL